MTSKLILVIIGAIACSGVSSIALAANSSINKVSVLFSSSAYAAETKPKLSIERATSIAIKTVPGNIKSSEFEHEMGQDVYSFDIVGKDNKIHEVLVNANNGKIVSNKIESVAKEAREAIEEGK